MFTPVFDKVNGSNYTLGDITVCNSEGVEFDHDASGAGVVGNGKIQVRKLTPGTSTATLSTVWGYTSAGYANRETNPNAWGWRSARNQELLSGEGLVIYNNMGAKIILRVQGEVVLKPQYAIPTGYSVWGNNTPVGIKLADITVCNKNGVEFDHNASGAGVVGNGKIQVRKLDAGTTSATLSTVWGYTSAGYPNRETNPNAWGWRSARNQELKAGEALVVYNNMGEEIQFKITGPLETHK